MSAAAHPSPGSHGHRNLRTLLARFAAVREAGPGRWRCKRPGSSGFNVGVAIGEKGGIVVNDFAGRSPAELLAELGMALSDLAPAKVALDRTATAEERREGQRAMAFASIQAAARSLCTQATLLQVAATMLAEGERLDAEDLDRLTKARDAIEAAHLVVREARRSISLAPVQVAAHALCTHAVVVQAAAGMLAEGQALSLEARDRLAVAHCAIEAASRVLSAEVRP